MIATKANGNRRRRLTHPGDGFIRGFASAWLLTPPRRRPDLDMDLQLPPKPIEQAIMEDWDAIGKELTLRIDGE